MSGDGSATVGVILGGGLARRMGGGDKPLQPIAGRTILERTIERLKPQCEALVLNANGDPGRFAGYGIRVVADSVEGYPGPLAGILAAMEWTAANQPDAQWLLSAAGDCPFLPHDLAKRLQAARIKRRARIAVARSGGQIHPVIALWDVGLRDKLRHALVAENIRRVRDWMERFDPAEAEWPDQPFDPFHNINTDEDLKLAEEFAVRTGN